jgi:hypothetical protein
MRSNSFLSLFSTQEMCPSPLFFKVTLLFFWRSHTNFLFFPHVLLICFKGQYFLSTRQHFYFPLLHHNLHLSSFKTRAVSKKSLCQALLHSTTVPIPPSHRRVTRECVLPKCQPSARKLGDRSLGLTFNHPTSRSFAAAVKTAIIIRETVVSV